MEKWFNSKKECFGCGSCAAICPSGAITMERDAEGFPYPVLDSGRCLDCGACKSACPAKQPLSRTQSRFYAVRCNDERLLQKSTSGGAFSLLAQEIVGQGGLACGACFDEKFHLSHRLSGEIAPMRKSKYLQSDMRDCFAAIQNALDGGVQVLFSGTPCQCHALTLFLGGRRNRLLLAAVVCRGVQSPGLWEDYAAWLGRDAPLKAYDFRDKRRLNDAHTVACTVGDRETAVPMDEDRFSRIYNKCLAYRPSCYACPYCDPDNDFDFMLGDFWGVARAAPEFADGKGTSLVIAHGERAASLMERIAEKARVIPCAREAAMQPALESPPKEPLLRRLLFRDFAKKDASGRCDIPLILKKYGG